MIKTVSELKVEIAGLNKRVSELQQQMTDIQKACVHTPYKTSYGSALCQHCQKRLGWWCYISPKNYCEYDDKHGENCIHCGEPEERK